MEAGTPYAQLQAGAKIGALLKRELLNEKGTRRRCWSSCGTTIVLVPIRFLSFFKELLTHLKSI